LSKAEGVSKDLSAAVLRDGAFDKLSPLLSTNGDWLAVSIAIRLLFHG
jgi:hypothetical protein